MTISLTETEAPTVALEVRSFAELPPKAREQAEEMSHGLDPKALLYCCTAVGRETVVVSRHRSEHEARGNAQRLGSAFSSLPERIEAYTTLRRKLRNKAALRFHDVSPAGRSMTAQNVRGRIQRILREWPTVEAAREAVEAKRGQLEQLEKDPDFAASQYVEYMRRIPSAQEVPIGSLEAFRESRTQELTEEIRAAERAIELAEPAARLYRELTG